PTLVKKVKEGGSGSWGQMPMPPHPTLSAADMEQMIAYVLSFGDPGTSSAAEVAAPVPGTEPGSEPPYRTFPVIGSRVAVWVVAELHLMFAAFVLAVPMFALIIEFIG